MGCSPLSFWLHFSQSFCFLFSFFLSIILFVYIFCLLAFFSLSFCLFIISFFVAFFSLSFCFHSVSITRLSFSFPHLLLLLLFALVKVCDAAKSAIDTQGNAALESVPVVEVIDSTSEIDYRLLEKPTFTTEYMATIHKVSHTELLKLFRAHCILILTLLTLVFLLPGRVLLHRSSGRGTLHPSPPPSHHQHHKDDLFLADRLHCGECGICVHHSWSSAVQHHSRYGSTFLSIQTEHGLLQSHHPRGSVIQWNPSI